jgi:hypothetical protein
MRNLQALLSIGLGLALGLAACSPAPRPAPTVARASEISAAQLPTVASCNGLTEEERRTPLFKTDLAGVEPLTQEQRVGARNRFDRPAGARLLLAARPDRNAQWLERVASCQAEMYQASGQSAADEPLSVPGARVERVRELKGGYAVEIKADDWDAAREIRARAESLLSQR